MALPEQAVTMIHPLNPLIMVKLNSGMDVRNHCKYNNSNKIGVKSTRSENMEFKI